MLKYIIYENTIGRWPYAYRTIVRYVIGVTPITWSYSREPAALCDGFFY